MPVLTLGGEGSLGPNMLLNSQPLAENVRGEVVSGCGHYLPSERIHASRIRLLAPNVRATEPSLISSAELCDRSLQSTIRRGAIVRPGEIRPSGPHA